MKKILIFSLLLGVTSDVFAIPTLTEASVTSSTVKFATKLSEILPKGYKVKIDLNNGKGLVAMTCSGLTCSLSSNTLPKNTTYKIGIYDAKGLQQGKTIDGSYMTTFTKNQIVETLPNEIQFYTKISNSGAVLSDTAKLGSAPNDWACTKDYKTGLIWEVKTSDGGLRDWTNTYSNYFEGDAFYKSHQGVNSDGFVKAVNKQTLCGASNWRLPTVDELVTLLYCSDGKYETDGSCTNGWGINIKIPLPTRPTINKVYFPNTKDEKYWSSTQLVDYYAGAWVVSFQQGYSFGFGFKSDRHFVRLVH